MYMYVHVTVKCSTFFREQNFCRASSSFKYYYYILNLKIFIIIKFSFTYYTNPHKPQVHNSTIQ